MEFRLTSPLTKRDILKYDKFKIITTSSRTKDIATFDWRFFHNSLTLREESFKQIHNNWIKINNINTGTYSIKRTLTTINYYILNVYDDAEESKICGCVF